MSGDSQIVGRAIGLPLDGIDTDQIVPARFLSRSRAAGYGDVLFHDLRRDSDGALRADFPLNRPEAGCACILVTRRNFGCGSSREAAVYALVDAGFRAVIAPSFSDIFVANAVNNGLVPATVGEDVVEALLRKLVEPREIMVCYEVGSIRAPGIVATFQLDATSRQKLINGWDDIDMTLALTDSVQAFQKVYQKSRPWSRLAQD